MSVGGIDIVIPLPPLADDWDATIRFVRNCWDEAIFEDGAGAYSETLREALLHFRRPAEFFIYENRESQLSWEQHGAIPENKDSMIHFIFREEITCVIGRPNSASSRLVAELHEALHEKRVMFTVGRAA